jgi:hypothetical protein
MKEWSLGYFMTLYQLLRGYVTSKKDMVDDYEWLKVGGEKGN